MAASVPALVGWIAAPGSTATGVLLIVAGCLHFVRLARWAGYRTIPDRLVLILHLAYAFIPTGFLLSGLTAFDVVAAGAGIHAWTGGAIGSMTIAVMTRATLGHTGRTLKASARPDDLRSDRHRGIGTNLRLRRYQPDAVLLAAAGTAWAFAFLGFAVLYGRALCTNRPA